MKKYLQAFELNIKIKKVEIRKLTARARLHQNETPSNYLFYYGWLRAWQKYLYKLVDNPWDRK